MAFRPKGSDGSETFCPDISPVGAVPLVERFLKHVYLDISLNPFFVQRPFPFYT